VSGETTADRPPERPEVRGPAGWRPPGTERRPGFATLIADPRAAGGRVGRELPAVQEAMRRHGFGHSLEIAERSGDGTRLTREALARGERFVVAVGGDPMANEVVNGFLEDDRPIEPDAVFGILAANSGCDAVRTFGLSQDPSEAVARFEVGRVYRIDVGRATVSGPEGTGSTWPAGAGHDGTATRYFLNAAQAGIGGAAVARAARLPAFVGPARHLIGYWAAVASSRRPLVRLRGDHRELEARMTNLLVSNLQFMGNGMLVSPRSWPEDGYLDLQVFTGPRSDSFTLLPRMFQGEHLPHPRVMELRSKAVSIESERPLWVEADGVPLGRTPARFEVVPQILPFLV
jgi:diacylglycerol kinase (ATP)